MHKPIAMALLAAALLLAGCSSIERLTNQTDDTVLPGQREEAIPGQAQFPAETAQPPKPGTAADAPAPTEVVAEEPKPCPDDQPDCVPPPTDDTFSDGQ